MDEARLEETAGGLAPATPGWFVVNAADAAWRTHEHFGSACRFEGAEAPLPSFGINVRALRPGQPNALYHRDETALRHGAGARSTTTDPGEAYPSFDPPEPGPPEPSGLPCA